MERRSVHIDNSGLVRFRAIIDRGLASGGNAEGSPIRRMFKRWAVRYMAFIRRRFTVFSRGGGDWAPLSPFTIARRRAGALAKTGMATGIKSGTKRQVKQTTRTVAILVDTAVLRNSLTVGAPGSLFEQIDRGCRVGVGPTSHNDDGLTIGDIAAFHQYGGGKLPQRKILVDPDQNTLDGMASDAVRMAREVEGEMK